MRNDRIEAGERKWLWLENLHMSLTKVSPRFLEKISDDLYLVDYKDSKFGTKYLVHAQDMALKREDGTYDWRFFETMETARKYEDWLFEDHEKVINIVR
jgi:hypothetical protein